MKCFHLFHLFDFTISQKEKNRNLECTVTVFFTFPFWNYSLFKLLRFKINKASGYTQLALRRNTDFRHFVPRDRASSLFPLISYFAKNPVLRKSEK